MKQILRAGAAIDVAFASAEKHHQIHPAHSPAETTFSDQNTLLVSDLPALPQNRWAAALKKLCRPVAKQLFRLLRPVLRPVAIRARNYLLNNIRAELAPEFHEVINEVRHQALLSQKALAKAKALQDMQTAQINITLARINADLQLIQQNSSAAARRVAIPCGTEQILVRSTVGYVLCCADDHALVAGMVEAGEFEPGTRQLIQQFLRTGDCFVDVGANVGMHSLAAAAKVGKHGKVIAFEPFEKTKNLLERNLWINGFSDIAEIHFAAVSDHDGIRPLYLGQTSGHHSLYPQSDTSAKHMTVVDARTVRLDNVIDPAQRVDLLKIDAEGAELEVIASADSVILNNPDIAIIIEFAPSHLKRAGKSPDKWLDTFINMGMRFRLINETTGELQVMTREKLLDVETANLFFSKSVSQAWQRLNIQ